jgi:hypothetical protein
MDACLMNEVLYPRVEVRIYEHVPYATRIYHQGAVTKEHLNDQEPIRPASIVSDGDRRMSQGVAGRL